MTRPLPHEEDPSPISDSGAILRDDVLVDALAKGVFPMEYQDDELVRSLLMWRDDIVSTPSPDSVSELAIPHARSKPAETSSDDATVLILPSRPAKRRRLWRKVKFSRPISIAAACAALALGSLGSVAVASVAKPGDALWPVAKVLNKERAESLEAREAALDELSDARHAVAQLDTAQARTHLEEAIAQAGDVRSKDGKGDLKKELAALETKIAAAEGNPTGPAQPSPGTTDPPTTPSPSSPPLDPSPTPSPSVAPSTPVSEPPNSAIRSPAP